MGGLKKRKREKVTVQRRENERNKEVSEHANGDVEVFLNAIVA